MNMIQRAIQRTLAKHQKAVAHTCSVKKVFLEISKNSQENTCARVSFLMKLHEPPATLLKKQFWHRKENFWWLLLNIHIREQ